MQFDHFVLSEDRTSGRGIGLTAEAGGLSSRLNRALTGVVTHLWLATGGGMVRSRE